MNSKFEISLLESGEFLKRSATALINNIGRTVAIITLAMTTLILFTNITVADFNAESFTSTMAIMLMASYVMYFSLEDSGERLGEKSEEYKSARHAYNSLIDKIGGESISRLRDFCREYSEDEISYRKTSILLSRGYSPEEYSAYKNGEPVSRNARTLFKRLDRLKAKALTPQELLTRERTSSKGGLQNPESSKLIRMILKLLPTTLCTVVTVSVMLTTKDDMSPATVIDGLFKLSALLIIGFKGYASGYNYTRYVIPTWLDTKSRLIEAFLKKQQ